jgi:hypothetical protein
MEVDVTQPQLLEVGGYSSSRGTPSQTGVRIGDTFVAFAMEEKTDAIPKPPPRPGSYSYGPTYERRPNGKLMLVIPTRQYSGERQRWSDGKRQRLEGQLNDFVAALIETAESLRLKAIEAEEERRRALAAEREREAAKRQRAAMALLACDLHRRMGAWRACRDTRSFVDLVKEWAVADGVDEDPRFNDWLQLAKSRIEAQEKKARSELLDRRHWLSYSSPLRQRFRWEDKASTGDLVTVVLNPHSQSPDDHEDAQAE